MIRNTRLSGAGSAKDVRHVVFDLAGSDLVGDLVPASKPATDDITVDELLTHTSGLADYTELLPQDDDEVDAIGSLQASAEALRLTAAAPRPVRLPAGVRDFLPRAAARRRAIAERLLATFEAWGYQRIITPVTTLWLFAVPLIDTLSVMLRRLWMKRSPFRPDRHHLHHLFLRAGFRVQDTVLVLAFVQLVFGVIGLGGLYAGVAELDMLIAFVAAFALCFYLLLRPWRFVPLLRRIHRLIGFTSAHAIGVHVSGLNTEGLGKFSNKLNASIGPRYDFRFTAFKRDANAGGCYGVIELLCDDQALTQTEVRDVLATIRREFRSDRALRIRQFVERKEANDRRVGYKPRNANRRVVDRRAPQKGLVIYRVLSAAGESSVLLQCKA